MNRKKTAGMSVTVETLTYVQELKALLSRERGAVVKIDETVSFAVREALQRHREVEAAELHAKLEREATAGG